MADKDQKEHRQRLKKIFTAGDLNSVDDEALLELLLTYAIPRKDVKPLAQKLLQRFGSLTQVLSSPVADLKSIKGMGPSSAALLKAVQQVQARAAYSIEGIQPEQIAEVPNPVLMYKESDIGPALETAAASSLYSDDADTAPPPTPKTSIEKSESKPVVRRKFQVSNGYLLEFDQLARVLNFLLANKGAKKIPRKAIMEDTGVADRQVESLVSMGTAIGLIKARSQVLTQVGLLIAENDIFIEKKGSLEWCHYIGAGSPQNLIWFEIFNRVLSDGSAKSKNEIDGHFRKELEGQYTKRTISQGLHEEVRFVVDAYLERNFSKLELLRKTSDESFYRSRYTLFEPAVLCAMIYDYCAIMDAHLVQVVDMATTPGSPAMVFGLDAASLRQQVELLHERGWLRYETTHNLDQVRLKPGFSSIEFLSAYYQSREPLAASKNSPGELF